MARIHITIDIPKDGPAQVSITTEDQTAARQPETAPKPRIQQVAQAPASDQGALRATREARGWTQKELATRIGCSVGTITLIESGKRPMSEKLRAKIRNAGLVLTTPTAAAS